MFRRKIELKTQNLYLGYHSSSRLFHSPHHPRRLPAEPAPRRAPGIVPTVLPAARRVFGRILDEAAQNPDPEAAAWVARMRCASHREEAERLVDSRRHAA